MCMAGLCTRRSLSAANKKELHITLREAKEEDSELLFNWRNDPVTRASSITTGEVKWEDHETWFKSALVDPKFRIFIAELSGTPVGTVRAEDKRGATELSWTISPGHRGKGIGRAMVKKAVDFVKGVISAKIRNENVSSIKIAVYSGFVLESEDERFQYWKRENH